MFIRIDYDDKLLEHEVIKSNIEEGLDHCPERIETKFYLPLNDEQADYAERDIVDSPI